MTQMDKEARESAKVIARQLQENQAVWEAVVQEVKAKKPAFAVTVARGSSDHAATYAKYLLETQLGLPTVSAAPSVQTLYNAELKLNNALVIGLSQSGQSPDIVETLAAAKKAGAITVAIVNKVNSPMAEVADFVVPQWAGDEISVAATKSYLSTLSALAQFVATFTQDQIFLSALDELPVRLTQAADCDWTPLINALKDQVETLVIGRGYGFPIVQEAALKFKETSALHAEAFSTAEVRHGPFALVRQDYPMLLMTQNDPSYSSAVELSKHILSLGAQSFLAAPEDFKPADDDCTAYLPLPPSLHPMLDPLMSIQAFYIMASKLALARGYDPDKPDNLKKVTETR